MGWEKPVGSKRWFAQSCPTLCNPVDCSLPDSSIRGILQARALERAAISFSIREITKVYNTCFIFITWWCVCYVCCHSVVLDSCDPVDCSPPGSSVRGILQARTLEWAAISFSNAWKWKWSLSVVSDPQRPHGLQPPGLLCPWESPGKNTGAGCHTRLQGASRPRARAWVSCLPPPSAGRLFTTSATW